jgi:excisionase family DNA binding protein
MEETMDKQEEQLSKYTTYTIKDVSKILRLSRVTISRFLKKPDFIPCFRIGGEVRFIKEDVLNWMDEQKTKAGKYYRHIEKPFK